MFSPSFPHGSVYIEDLTWSFTFFHVTEMSVGSELQEVWEQARDMIRFVNRIFEPSCGGSIEGGMNSGPEFNLSSTSQLFDLLQFIM